MAKVETGSSVVPLPAIVGGKLGLRRIESDHDLVERVERQLPASAVKALVRSGFSDAEVYELVIPRRTLAHRRAKRQKLSRDESDKAVRVARVVALAERVFGERERAWRWLRKAKRQFEKKAPVDMLATEAGSRLVEEALVRIDQGLAA
jgi:putative toxin-antitoxin system antitoxin component (TIGR02293 family)